MGVLSDLEPNNVFRFFEEICQIPHGSGNVEGISDYLVSFAKERGLRYIQDEVKNVILFKEASAGYEQEPTVILQGHMDMVAVHKPDYNVDMATEPLRLKTDGDNVYAEGTSLGGDDGIAVAYALAILDDDSIEHPALEIIITVDEEVGMDGARAIDLSELKGHRLLNLDSEEEGIFLTSCAGGARVSCELSVKSSKISGTEYEIILGGLQGGHSGVEIIKERGNSNVLLGRLLWKLASTCDIGLLSACGGVADNAITSETKVNLLASSDRKDFLGLLREFDQQVQAELASKDPGFALQVIEKEYVEMEALAGEELKRAAAYLNSLPNGVQAMSADIAGLVETSLNQGILRITPSRVYVEYSVRSSLESSKHALLEKLSSVTVLAGGTTHVTGNYPGWAYRVDSPLRDKMVRLYEDMYGEKPKVEAVHAGLECGLLAGKIADLDCVSFGPNMNNIHTAEESLSISSTARVWEYLIRLLATKDGD